MLLVKTGHKDYLGRMGTGGKGVVFVSPGVSASTELAGHTSRLQTEASNCTFASKHWDPWMFKDTIDGI